MKMYDVVITLHNTMKDTVKQEDKQVRDFTDMARMILTYKVPKGYKVIEIKATEYVGLF